MALKARLSAAIHAALDAALKPLYRQDDDGEFILDVEPADGYELQDIAGLKSTLGKQKQEISTLKSASKLFEGLDATEAKNAIEAMKKLGNLTPEQLAEQKVQSALQQTKQQFDTQLAAKDSELQAMTSKLERTLIDQQATASIVAKGGNVKLLLPHVKSSVKVKRDDKGEFSTQVLDSEGNPRIHVAKGQPRDMTIEDLVEEMSASTDFASAFTAQNKSGNNSQTNHTRTSTNSRPKTVDANDASGLSNSLEAIAKGEVVVTGMAGEAA